jgi:hypothetical protein
MSGRFNLNRTTVISACLVGLFFSIDVMAADLAQILKYRRCYQLLTGSALGANAPHLADVQSGAMTASEACASLVNQTSLDGNGQLSNQDPVYKSILANFQRVHMSWFVHRDFEGRLMREIYDSGQPALYWTKSLFDTSFAPSQVFTTTTPVRALRTLQDPLESMKIVVKKINNVSYPIHPVDDTVLDEPMVFAPRGDLLGVILETRDIVPWSYTNSNNVPLSGSQKMFGSVGPGILGDIVFIRESEPTLGTPLPDGGVAMSRKWARNVFQDLLCRELPAVRSEDATSFVAPDSDVPFRTAASCVICHASMDRMAGVLRGASYVRIGAGNLSGLSEVNGIKITSVVRPAEQAWPTASDSDFYRRPASGVLYYRNYQGQLVDIPLQNIGALGTALAQQDDPYICAAKRYYKYFTGKDVDVGDLYGKVLTSEHQLHRARVIELGQQLKQNQDPKFLINKIISDYMP